MADGTARGGPAGRVAGGRRAPRSGRAGRCLRLLRLCPVVVCFRLGPLSRVDYSHVAAAPRSTCRARAGGEFAILLVIVMDVLMY